MCLDARRGHVFWWLTLWTGTVRQVALPPPPPTLPRREIVRSSLWRKTTLNHTNLNLNTSDDEDRNDDEVMITLSTLSFSYPNSTMSTNLWVGTVAESINEH